MNTDKALAAGLTREMQAARARALAEDHRSTRWTDRDVARRMTEAGHPMAHPAVIRARTGQRTVSVGEWLTFAYVLSVPPLRLLEPTRTDGLRVGGVGRSSEDVRQWIHGVRPLDDLERRDVFYSTTGHLTRPESSVFSGTLRALADQFDTATSERERTEIAAQAAQTAITDIQGRHRFARVDQRRKSRDARPRPGKSTQRAESK